MMRQTIPVFLLAGASLLFAAKNPSAERLQRAAEVFQEVMGTPDKAIPQQLLDKAQCVVVIPGLKKAGFIFGVKFGRGFVSCRPMGNAGWMGPGAVRIEGGSFGLQIGGAETDVIMLVMNQRGMDRLLSSKFTLGGDASVAAGPVGRDATAQTDAYMSAEILAWSRSRGLFAGISLQGATLRQELDTNRDLYGRTIENKEVFSGKHGTPAAAKGFLSVLTKYSGRKS